MDIPGFRNDPEDSVQASYRKFPKRVAVTVTAVTQALHARVTGDTAHKRRFG